MPRLVSLLALAAAFGAAAWVGHRLRSGGGEEPPPAAPSDPPVADLLGPSGTGSAGPDGAAVPGDLDDGTLVGRPPEPKAKEARPAATGEPIRLVWEDLTEWDLDPKNVQVPESIRAYEGKRVDLVGYMIPYGNPDAIEEFIIVNDLGSCCFGQSPLPHHLVECRMAEGKTTAYVPGPVRIRGAFSVREHRQGDFLISVYGMVVEDCVEVR